MIKVFKFLFIPSREEIASQSARYELFGSMLPLGLILLIFFFISSSAFALEPLWPAIEKCQFEITMKGEFSNQGDRNVNLLNAPITELSKQPAPLKISEAMLQVLNQNKEKVFYESIKKFGMRSVKKAQGVCPFHLTLSFAGDNDLGGHYSGLTVRLKLDYLPGLNGEGVSQIKIADSKEEILTNLRKSYSEIINHAFEDLQTKAIKTKNH